MRDCLRQKKAICCDCSVPNFFAFELIWSRKCCKRKSQEARKALHTLFAKERGKKSLNVTNSLNYATTASVVLEQTVFCNIYNASVTKNMLGPQSICT